MAAPAPDVVVAKIMDEDEEDELSIALGQLKLARKIVKDYQAKVKELQAKTPKPALAAEDLAEIETIIKENAVKGNSISTVRSYVSAYRVQKKIDVRLAKGWMQSIYDEQRPSARLHRTMVQRILGNVVGSTPSCTTQGFKSHTPCP